MKLSYLLPCTLFAIVCCLPACEYDKVNTIVEYYSPDEYQVLTSTLDLPSTPFNYNNFNFGFGGIDGTGTLGRVLFYDTNLSSDNSVSCGSCHQQHLAFADDVPFSKGIENRSTARNSLALGAFSSFETYNQDPQTTLFWDGRVDNLHDQMIQTIRNPNEMGMELRDIVEKIKNLDYYKVLTQKAFHNDRIEQNLILIALSNFMNSITSSSSKFDIASTHAINPVQLNPWPDFTTQENRGKFLFTNNCVSCHSLGLEVLTPFSLPVRSANNGLDLVYTDKGAGTFNSSPDALAIFKVPGLRNIELTAPYMHDGRFSTLEEVIDFYSDGIQDHQNLNILLKENGHAKKFNFTESDKTAVVAFLKTLTDHTMTNETKWSDPFL